MSFQRRTFNHENLTLSYLDTGSSPASINRPPLLCLHAHLMQGATYTGLAEALSPDYRVIAPDQRGHGDSSHAATYTREDYLGDIEALLASLDLPQAVLLGNSLGGVNAYQFAARHPDRVRALIIEDIGAVVADDISFVLPWQGVYTTREELESKIDDRFIPYLRDSFRHSEEGCISRSIRRIWSDRSRTLLATTGLTGLLPTAAQSSSGAAKAGFPQQTIWKKWQNAAPIRIS
jgi:pimeloyl-ACP methyl ester carboxylesterase